MVHGKIAFELFSWQIALQLQLGGVMFRDLFWNAILDKVVAKCSLPKRFARTKFVRNRRKRFTMTFLGLLL